jgi:predicted aconitase with swiveling domain
VRLQGRKVAEGRAEGRVAKSSSPLSFLGELDPATGTIDNPSSELHGRSVAGQVLVFPEARGSTVGPYVLYGAKKRGVAPVALVVHDADVIVASAAVLARIPCVDRIDLDLLQEGDLVRIDGGQGTVELPEVKEVPVVTALLQDPQGRVLLLRRSEKVGTFQGRWAGVSGFVEGQDPLAQAHQEIREELSVEPERLELVKRAPEIYARDGSRVFAVHPFLFRIRDPEVRLDWEHTEFRWILPVDLREYPTVPRLDRVFRALGLEVHPPPSSPSMPATT